MLTIVTRVCEDSLYPSRLYSDDFRWLNGFTGFQVGIGYSTWRLR
jgi:hypothetical protein